MHGTRHARCLPTSGSLPSVSSVAAGPRTRSANRLVICDIVRELCVLPTEKTVVQRTTTVIWYSCQHAQPWIGQKYKPFPVTPATLFKWFSFCKHTGLLSDYSQFFFMKVWNDLSKYVLSRPCKKTHKILFRPKSGQIFGLSNNMHI